MIEDFLRLHGDYFSDKYFKDLTTIKMGGHIAHYVLPNNVDDLNCIIDYLKNNKILFKIIGNGSNLVCGESEFSGVVINLKQLNKYNITDNEIYAEAGVLAPSLAYDLANRGLSCLEFASGIPGTIGGLIYMNAGAYKCEMSKIVKEVLVLKNGELSWMTNEECNFSYRSSIFHDHPRWVIVAAKMKFALKNKEEILELMEDRLYRRKNTQPLDMPSAGSCFRNPDNNFAWRLIDNIGYRGFCKNGVCVSNKHSNFIVNQGDGTAENYLDIVYDIQKKVNEKFGIKLVMEVEKFNC